MMGQRSKNSLQGFKLYYMFSLILGVLSWGIWGVILAVQISLTVFTGLILAELSLRYAMQREWHLIVAELFMPAIFWLFFGPGTLVCLSGLEDIPNFGPYEDTALLLNSFYVLIASISYILGFRLVYRWLRGERLAQVIPSAWRVTVLLFILLAFDWYTRLQLIRTGTYFTWVMRVGIDESIRGTSFLYHIQRTIWTVIWPLLVYKIATSRLKWFYTALLLLQMGLVISAGDRGNIVFSIIIILLSYAVVYKITINWKMVALGVLAFLIFFAVLGPMIQEARYLMRRDGRALLEDPARIPVLFFTEYLPAVMDPALIFNIESGERQGLLARLGSVAGYFGSVQQAYLDGEPLLGYRQGLTVLSMLTPRFLNPNKIVLDADLIVQEHFRIGLPGHDTPGSIATDAFAHLHVWGILILFLFLGGGYGFVTSHLVHNYGIVGKLILIGLLPIFLPISDSFGVPLGNLRNVLLLLIVFKLVLHFGRVSIPVGVQLPESEASFSEY